MWVWINLVQIVYLNDVCVCMYSVWLIPDTEYYFPFASVKNKHLIYNLIEFSLSLTAIAT
jgi:hypothetical protein